MYLQVQKKASDVAPHALLSACHGSKDEDPPWKTERYHGLHYHIHAVPRRGRHRYRLISFHLLPSFLKSSAGKIEKQDQHGFNNGVLFYGDYDTFPAHQVCNMFHEAFIFAASSPYSFFILLLFYNINIINIKNRIFTHFCSKLLIVLVFIFFSRYLCMRTCCWIQAWLACHQRSSMTTWRRSCRRRHAQRS